MKKIALSLSAFIFLFTLLLLGGKPKNPGHEEKYCAKMKDGVVKVMHLGAPITTEVTLANGTRIMTDGTILKTDGSNAKLKEGECIDKDGKIESDVLSDKTSVTEDAKQKKQVSNEKK